MSSSKRWTVSISFVHDRGDEITREQAQQVAARMLASARGFWVEVVDQEIVAEDDSPEEGDHV